LAIELEDVSFTYLPGTPYERQALKGIRLTIAEGSITALAGHTGSGKSTLLQHIGGLIHPDSGRVCIDGTDLAAHTKQEKRAALAARRKVGLVFQYAEHQLFEESVYEDIAFGPRNFGLAETEVAARVREAMARVHLDFEAYRDRSPFQLSGGQMRRVALAGVLALHPAYLVLDEPTAGLDPRGRRELLALIRGVARGGGDDNRLRLAQYGGCLRDCRRGRRAAAGGDPLAGCADGCLYRARAHRGGGAAPAGAHAAHDGAPGGGRAA
jgi:energy-coupling factor transport system ATP-binding protein